MRKPVAGFLAWAAIFATHALCAAALSLATPVRVEARARQQLDIPAGTLASALGELARQTGTSIGGTEPGLDRVRTPAVQGRMSVAAALDRLLSRTQFMARRIGARSFRIERRRAPARASSAASGGLPLPVTRPAPATEQAPPPQPIIVTASKRDVDYFGYSGGATIMDLDRALPGTQAGSLENLLSVLPITASTNLGSGRNKLFIRGVADSSFNGPTQSTVGLYYGDLRLIYSAPNPDLRLYDIERVELLEGPQGTLYGAGALGGVIRIAPHRAVPEEWQASNWAGGALTSGGDDDYDIAGMVNVPVGNAIAMRFLGYRGRLGGYVDDLQRGLANVNRTRIQGWRATIRAQVAPDWTVDLDGLQQMLDTRDGQYVDAGLGGLQRRSAIDQPFDSDIIGGGATIKGNIGGLVLTSATGLIRSDLDTRFDASVLSADGSPIAFQEERRIHLLSHETRLASDPAAAFSWVIGLSMVRNKDTRTQFLGDPDEPEPRAEVLSQVTEYALFGEGTLPVTRRLSISAGARIVHGRTFAEASLADGSEIDPKASDTRILPTFAVSWHGPEVMAYARFQRGNRAGGLSIDGIETGAASVSRFDPDRLQTFEIGSRGSFTSPVPIEYSIAAFFTDWDAIQADLIGTRGFPVTRNIGKARIYGITASASVEPIPRLRLSGAMFVNRSRFVPAEDFVPGEEEQLPNVAELGARASAELVLPVAEGVALELATAVDFTGESFLGVDPTSQRPQGNFHELSAAATLRSRRWSLSLEATNLTNTRGNSFSFGNPFTLQDDNQLTPARPRRFRLTGRIDF